VQPSGFLPQAGPGTGPRRATHRPDDAPAVRRLAVWLAKLGPVGLSPVVPATVGSALVAGIGWFVPVPTLPVFLACLALATAIAIWAAGEAEKELGHDASPIIIDEAVGQTIALMFVP